jgi:hypothetical protein
MRHLSFTKRSFHAAGIVLLVLAPLHGDAHVHEAEHDGVTQHLERAHGGHVPAVAEQDARVPSGDVRVSFDAASVVVSPVGDSFTGLVVSSTVTPRVDRPPRAPPPGTFRSRAPPLLSEHRLGSEPPRVDAAVSLSVYRLASSGLFQFDTSSSTHRASPVLTGPGA